LIVALLGWTVNQPIMGCEGQHSRAAVVLQAGASPAYQPEPSPTRHSCCPRESKPTGALPSSQHPACPHQFDAHQDCCSLTNETHSGLPPVFVKESPIAKYVLASLSAFEPMAAPQEQASLGVTIAGASEIQVSSFAVLRL